MVSYFQSPAGILSAENFKGFAYLFAKQTPSVSELVMSKELKKSPKALLEKNDRDLLKGFGV